MLPLIVSLLVLLGIVWRIRARQPNQSPPNLVFGERTNYQGFTLYSYEFEFRFGRLQSGYRADILLGADESYCLPGSLLHLPPERWGEKVSAPHYQTRAEALAVCQQFIDAHTPEELWQLACSLTGCQC